MEVFGMARSPDGSSFDYLTEANAKRGQNQNESISFLLDASAIAGSTNTANTDNNSVKTDGANADGGSLASTKEQKQAFYSLHDTAVSEFLAPSPITKSRTNNNNNNSSSSPNYKLYQSMSPQAKTNSGSAAKEAEKTLSPFAIPSLTAKKEVQKENTMNQKPTSIPRPKINTRRSLSSTNGKKLATPGSARQQIPQTPGGFWTTNTESKTFVNGLLSPFSPLLHSAVHKQGTANNLPTINDDQEHNEESNIASGIKNSLNQTLKRQREEYMQYVSLQPCRKVSVVVRVAAVDEDEDAKRCIFPHFKDELLPSGGSLSSPIQNLDNNIFATPKGKHSNTSMTTPLSAKSTSSRLSSPTHRRDVVVVNPTAFGKYIPSQVTMETAKLVAQVANISSEDWARLYEFHHVMWPTPTKSRENNKRPSIVGSPQGSPKAEDLASSYNTMDSLSRAVVQDLLAEHESSLLISMGHESSCFGTTSLGEGNASSIGLWPKIMNQCAAMLETKGVVRLTMVEILEGEYKMANSADSFRDLLVPENQKPTPIRLRHHDMKGAILEGLCEVEIDSMPALLAALAKSRQRRAQRRKQNGKNGSAASSVSTTVIGTLHYWEQAVNFELNKPSNATVTCVELAHNQSSNSSNSITETLDSITHRKSVVSLGQALRQLLLQQVRGTGKSLGLSTSELNPVICYRESTLTKVLQRSMESSKIVLLASISPLSRDYKNTVSTLNYLRRLLVKPGMTPASPFGGRGSGHNRTPPKTAKTDNRSYTHTALDMSNVVKSVNSAILSSPEAIENKEKLQTIANKDPKFLEQQLVSDPRQRLARYFSPIKKKAKPKPWAYVLDRMEDSQKSTTGTPSAITVDPVNDTSTLGSNSNTNSVSANSYAGPIETRNPEEDDNDGVGSYQSPPQGGNNGGDDDKSDEYDSEDEIERAIAASAHKRKLEMEKEKQDQSDGDDDNGDDSDGRYTPSEADTLPEIHPETSYFSDDDDDNSNGDHSNDIPQVPTDDTDVINDHLEEDFPPDNDDDDNVDDGDDQNDRHGADSPNVNDDSTEDPANETNYDLPDDPPNTDSVDKIHVHRPPPSPRSPYQIFNSYASSYSVSLKTSKSKEYKELTSEREELRATVAKLTSELRTITEERNTNIHHYETEIEKLYTKLDVAEKAKYELETVASKAIYAKTSSEEQMETYEEEKEELQRTVDSLRNELSRLSEQHENDVFRHQKEMNDFRSKLERERKEIEDIAEEAVNDHRTQVEETKVITNERDELRITIESLKRTMQSLERDQGDNVSKYHQQIRELHAQLEETTRDKRSIQQEANDSRFQVETLSEKLRLLTREREELQSTLSSVKGSVKKASEDNDDYFNRLKNEIQELHMKLEDANSEKVRVEKSVEEIRFEKEEFERRSKGLEEELSASRSNTLRLEKIRREEQETIRKMNIEIRRIKSESVDMDHFKSELERLKRHKDHLESLVAHRKVESSTALTQLEGDFSEAKSRIVALEDELSTIRKEFSSSQDENRELREKLRSAYHENSHLSAQLRGREESLQILQASCDNLESLRIADGDVIAKLNDQLRNQESSSLEVEQLRHKFSRLKYDHSHLQEMMESRKIEYERSMEEKVNEISIYTSRLETLQMELEKTTTIEKRYRNDAEAQLQSLQASEANLIQNLRQRDSRIDQLKNEMELQRNELHALREREASSSQAESEMLRLQERLAKLEITLDITAKEREEAVERVKSESRSHKSVLNELKQSKDEVHRYKNILKELNEELDNRQEENLKAKERIYQMESTLRTFKKETKERVRTFAGRENDTNGVVERTRDENRDLNRNLRDMNDIVARLRHERDICFQSLQDGRKKLSELSSRKDSLTSFDELYSTPSINRRSRSPRRGREHRTGLRPYPPPVEAVTARASNRVMPEIFVTSYQLGSPTTPAEERAEEIAACIAQNARETLVENLEEVSQLRSQIYRLEDERSEQVASLKSKVSNLEKELTIEKIGLQRSLHEAKSEEISSLRAKVRNLERELSYERVGNRTPLMGTTSRRPRKQNHFVDWDEKREY